MKKPAARINDYHTCPAYRGDTPHIGGNIVKGSTDVFINGKAAARVGDSAKCDGVGMLDPIAAGSGSVFVNNIAVARLGDPTVHGGKIVAGSGNVEIG